MIYRFFEVPTDTGFEYYKICCRNKSYFRRDPLRLSYGSVRIWEWDLDNDSVFFVKNRHGTDTEVDHKEFTLVKLRAHEYSIT